MQRMVLLAVLAALAILGGCAQRDPNLLVRGLGEFGHTAGDYTLSVKTYVLDAEGRATLADADDASFRGFVDRTLAAQGYTQKASGPARYGLEIHMLCANTRLADMGFMGERLRLPAQAVGAGYSKQVHFWLPDQDLGLSQSGQDAMDRRESFSRGRNTSVSYDRPSQGTPSGAGRQQSEHCQGRVLVVLTPAGPGPVREMYVGRAATEDCTDANACAVGDCRTALEHSLVDLLEHSF